MCTIRHNNRDALNCMTVIAGKDISFNHRVLLGHNEDDDGHTAVRHAYVPARDWPDGSVLPAEEGLARIPQVEHTYGYYWIEYKKEDGGLTVADSFVNENGVVVVSNGMGKSKEDSDDPSVVCDGGIGFNMRRILAERSRTARDGVRILMELMEKWGYAPSGRAYTIADKNEAFMFQLVRGHHYIGARIPDNAVAVMPNHYNFHTLHDCPEMYYSEDLVSYAIEKGWYTPAVAGDDSDFDFALAYQHAENYKSQVNTYRQKHGQRILLHRDWDTEKEGFPFVIYPEKMVDVEALAKVFSTHYEGTEDERDFSGPGRSPHYVPDVRRICAGCTLESDIYELAEIPECITVYTCLGRPCQLPYLPVHPLSGMPEALREEMDPCEMMDTHLMAEEGALAYADTLRQRMRDTESRLEMVFAEEIDNVRPMLKALLDDARRESTKTVEKLAVLHAEGKRTEAAEYACEADGAFMKMALEKMEMYAAEHESKVQIDAVEAFERKNMPEKLTLTIHSEKELTAQEMVFGAEHTDICKECVAADADSFHRIDAATYRVDFPVEKFGKELGAGKQMCWLGGRYADGCAFAAPLLIEVR